MLEALLRLRQAACHPGLIDPRRAGEPRAKLDVLLPQLAEVIDEGHKVLVFSQFTSLLALVRDAARRGRASATSTSTAGPGIAPSAVERFQNDPTRAVFLISLKAGGLGLNLTAAEYVFLLDPWWNPAVEAQAIDRAHRIGQTQHVFAYRLIAADTVEEKILELQQTQARPRRRDRPRRRGAAPLAQPGGPGDPARVTGWAPRTAGGPCCRVVRGRVVAQSRSATSGSTTLARRAGIAHAETATTARITVIDTNVSGSVGVT